jgi:acetyl esterase/lipase
MNPPRYIPSLCVTALLSLSYSFIQSASSQTNPKKVPTPPKGIILERDIPYCEGHARWVLNMIVPEKKSSRPRPAVVLIHGGGWSTGDQYKFTKMGYSFAEEGYVVMLPTYRLYRDAPFPACLEDVKNSIRWLRANAKKYNIDPNRIGAYGNSTGATLALTVVVTGEKELEGDGPNQDQSSELQAVVGSGAVGDMLHSTHSKRAKSAYLNMARGTDRNLSESKANKLMKAASPSSYITKSAPPILLVHGTKDDVVIINSTDEFVGAMKKAGADITYLRFEGAGHSVMGQKGKETTPAMMKFFKKHL